MNATDPDSGDAIAQAIGSVMQEIHSDDWRRADEPDGAFCQRAREHILDRWYRFSAYGVTSRSDLAAVSVTVELVMAQVAVGKTERQHGALAVRS